MSLKATQLNFTPLFVFLQLGTNWKHSSPVTKYMDTWKIRSLSLIHLPNTRKLSQFPGPQLFWAYPIELMNSSFIYGSDLRNVMSQCLFFKI